MNDEHPSPQVSLPSEDSQLRQMALAHAANVARSSAHRTIDDVLVDASKVYNWLKGL
jgi:hypothetical protein